MPIRTLADRDSDPCCARKAIVVCSPSSLESMVLLFSFSKKTAMFKAFIFLVHLRWSDVFLGNQLMDLASIRSIFPASQFAIMKLNSCRELDMDK